MTKVFPLCVLLLSMSAFAQTTYTQSQPAHCNLADYVCNNIPLVGGGSYSFVDGSNTIHLGDHFTLYVNGVYNFGAITGISQAPPLLRIGNVGSFSFSWAANGLHGTVSGYITVEKVCGRYCWPMAWIESSTVTAVR